MSTWVMQYRTRKSDSDVWGDWADLPERLLFSHIYVPLQFEFRAKNEAGERAFVFRGSAINEASLLGSGLVCTCERCS